jgi:parallel beta-helix repeat protein
MADLLNGSCIAISNTRVTFHIVDCMFIHENYSDATIALTNVTYGTVQNCTFTKGAFAVRADGCHTLTLWDLKCSDSIVTITNSLVVTVALCIIDGGPGDGVYLVSSSNSIIIGNSIGHCAASGISLSGSSINNISGNTLIQNSMFQIELDGTSFSNAIAANVIFKGGMLATARDNGAFNDWDGNWWSDYSGSGQYSIEGSAHAVDHYPLGYIPSTTTSTTTTSTTTSQEKETPAVTVGLFAPMDPTTRVILVGEIMAFLVGVVLVPSVYALRQRRMRITTGKSDQERLMATNRILERTVDESSSPSEGIQHVTSYVGSHQNEWDPRTIRSFLEYLALRDDETGAEARKRLEMIRNK